MLSSSQLFPQSDSADLEYQTKPDSLSLKIYKSKELFREIADSLGSIENRLNKERKMHYQQLITLSQIQRQLYEFQDYFRYSIDTSATASFLSDIREEYNIAVQGALGVDSNVTIRNLSTTRLLLEGMITKLDLKKKSLTAQLKKLEDFRKAVDSLQTDSTIYHFAQDSALFIQYFNKITEISSEMAPIDSSLNSAIQFSQSAIDKINRFISRINLTVQDVSSIRKSKAENILTPETNGLLKSGGVSASFPDALNYSVRKGGLLFRDYISNHAGRIFLAFAAFTVLCLVLRKIRRRLPQDEEVISRERAAILSHPVLFPVFITLAYFSFVFPSPPVVFQGFLWLILSLLLIYIIWKVIARSERFVLLFLVVSFAFSITADLILKESAAERWLVLLICLAGLALSVLALKKSSTDKRLKRTKLIVWSISAVILSAALVSNVLGSFNLAKTMTSLAFFMLVTGYVLSWAFIFSTELSAMYALTAGQDLRSSQMTKDGDISGQLPRLLSYLLPAGWVFLMIRNFYLFEEFIEGLQQFLKREYSIGDITFSFEKFLLFILILVISTLISKIVSFFAKGNETEEGGVSQRGGISNWMLLIRIAVMSIGLLLAFAATGLPLDKLTIIIGSLGVGIGLGLQNIVGNLVSGVLLAFEKPFRIGDQIEVDHNFGTIKEIGIRSSKLSTPDGADVIIPNGDLLSKHVTNWTLRNMLKRSEIIQTADVSGHTQEFMEAMKLMLMNNDKVSRQPEPGVFMNEYADDGSTFRLLYWTDIQNEDKVRTEILLSIERELKRFARMNDEAERSS